MHPDPLALYFAHRGVPPASFPTEKVHFLLKEPTQIKSGYGPACTVNQELLCKRSYPTFP